MRLFLAFTAILVLSCTTKKEMIQSSENQIVSEIKETNFSKPENVAKTLSFLASDELEGRDSGSEGIEKASIFLERILKENGVKPYFNSYRDTLTNFDKPSYNIVGYIEGNDPKLKNEFVIIGAHYDHIGKIAAVNGDDIGNGANDNASGTTAVTEVVKYFAKSKSNKRSLIFAFFSAEEKGLLGSKHLAKKLKKQNMNLYFMFNFEMIGIPMKDRDMLMYITGFGKSNMAQKINEYANEKLVGYLPIETQYQLFRASDNYPFFNEFEVPAQTVSTFDFENFQFYHQPDDEFELMNPTHMANVVNKMIPVLEEMMNAETKEIVLKK
ncbi:peptidase M28 [Flavobacterium sp. 316]|uniref:M28 family metallopeptidase n=1 Tax=Flavobacterium sp. 316 TaxID=1603293 RepID=UPI0005E3FAFA|nr:M20/M25/M40 family metallo-hydrolase [Flavobacterium sp. 316]KIX21447.1 peptidase M28 [Flavobacterium sp. 316]